MFFSTQNTPINRREKQKHSDSSSFFKSSLSTQSSLKITSSQSRRTIQRTCCLFISYLFSFPFPMSRFCTFLLWFFTHLSFKSGELIKDRRSLPVFQHPKPRQRVKAFRPKSIYGAPRQAASAYTQPCCLLSEPRAANVACSAFLRQKLGVLYIQQSVIPLTKINSLVFQF